MKYWIINNWTCRSSKVRDFCLLDDKKYFLSPFNTCYKLQQFTNNLFYFLTYFTFIKPVFWAFYFYGGVFVRNVLTSRYCKKYNRVSQKKCSYVGIGWNFGTYFLGHPVCIYWATELRWCCYYYFEINKHWGKEIFDTTSQILFTGSDVLCFLDSQILSLLQCYWMEKKTCSRVLIDHCSTVWIWNSWRIQMLETTQKVYGQT